MRLLIHPLLIGEIACGPPPNRSQTLRDLGGLQQAQQASVEEVMLFIEREALFGLGCGLFFPAGSQLGLEEAVGFTGFLEDGLEAG